MSTLLITGSTGNYGSAAINYLLQKGTDHTIVALTRDRNKAKALIEKGVEVRIGDYENPDSLEKAFTNIDKLLFISGSELENRSRQHENVIKAARAAKVGHVVYTSIQRKREGTDSPISFVVESHLKTEKLLKESGFTYTILKNNMYMDYIPLLVGEQALKTGTIYLPAGEGKAAFVTRDNMAEASANILITEGHDNKTYLLANTSAYSFHDVANTISELTGKKMNYVSPPAEEYSGILREAGVPEATIGMTVGFAQAIDQEELDETSKDLPELLENNPVSLKDFLQKVYGK